MAVADETETPVDELPPLYTAIDPDALDAIVQPRSDGRTEAGPRVSFTIAGCTVDVGDGTVVVTADAETAADSGASTRAHAN
ncbi:hypothetical protein J0X25_07155 [Haloterrigena alkaliphila]|nr:hypothetical protein J0X25_07155 [Haloterrigena alkaliphila]